jgi:hypothetical protein
MYLSLLVLISSLVLIYMIKYTLYVIGNAIVVPSPYTVYITL